MENEDAHEPLAVMKQIKVAKFSKIIDRKVKTASHNHVVRKMELSKGCPSAQA